MVQTRNESLEPLSEPLIDTDLIDDDDDDWKQLQRAQPRKRLITPKRTQIYPFQNETRISNRDGSLFL